MLTGSWKKKNAYLADKTVAAGNDQAVGGGDVQVVGELDCMSAILRRQNGKVHARQPQHRDDGEVDVLLRLAVGVEEKGGL